jgi:ketosteroid isomerase-like protein
VSNLKKLIMKRLIFNTIAASLLMLISFGTFAQSTGDMKSFITKTNQEMMDLIKSGNYNALDKYYDAEAVSLPNYRAKEIGYKLILNNNLGRQKGGYEILDGKKTTTELIVGQDMMVDIGTYTLTATFPGLSEPKVDNGKYLNVWKKNKEGVWKLVAETWNADKSPNAPAAKPGQPGSMPAPTGVQNAKPGAQPGTTAPGTTGSGGKSAQSGTGTDAGSKAVPAQGTTTVTKGSTEAKPAATGTTTSGSKAVPATGTTTTKGTSETKPAATGTTTSGSKAVPATGTTTTKGTSGTKPATTGTTTSGAKAVPASGTTTTKGTTETKSTQTGTTKTGTVTPTGTTTTKGTTDTNQKTPVTDPNAGKK